MAGSEMKRSSDGSITVAVDLSKAVQEVLARAQAASSGRAAITLTPGAGSPLSQTVMALTAERALQEHQAPGPATLHILSGSVLLRTGDHSLKLIKDDWVVIPDDRHDLLALSDAVVLLTVATAGQS